MPIHYKPDELPLIGAITAKDIRDEVIDLGSFYPEADEVALVRAAERFFDLQFKVDVLSEDEPVFNKVEKLVTDIPRSLREYDENIQADDASILIYPKTVNGEKMGSSIPGEDGVVYQTKYKPLADAYAAYHADWNLKFSSLSDASTDENPEYKLNRAIVPLTASTYRDPWSEIENFEPLIKNYSTQEKEDKVNHVVEGLRNNTQAVRDVYLDDCRKLMSTLKKLEFQGNNVDAWSQNLEARKSRYLVYLFEEALLVDCKQKLDRLGDPIY